MQTVLVTPHSTAPDALAATARTLAALPGTTVAYEADGTPALDSAGRLRLSSADPDFVLFAIKQQGYALDAVKEVP